MSRESTRRGVRLSHKIIGAVLLVLVLVTAVNYLVFMTGYRADLQRELMRRASGFTAVADKAKNHASSLHRSNAFDTERLIADALDHVEQGGSYTETDFFGAIPVIVGWNAGAEAAAEERMNFRVVALDARNPERVPKEPFVSEMLLDLSRQFEAGGDPFIGRVDEDTNTLHYMRAIVLDETCMSCHGDPAVYDERDEAGQYDGKDLLGFRMESWVPGQMHGAYEVALLLDEADAQVAGFFRRALLFTVPITCVAVLGIMYLTRGLVATPLHRLMSLMEAAGGGDLTQRMRSSRADEIGRLGTFFDAFMESLCTLVNDVRGATHSVASASAQIAASADEMASGLTSQEQQTHQVAAAVEEMSKSVAEVASKSGDAARAAAESERRAAPGGGVVQRTVAEMRGIADEVQVSADSVNSLGQKGEQIGEIIGVINEIADQTNLLALNAAIEAARAGEHGRGFAVVADEVRKLAERTQSATEEVANSIGEIQSETTSAVHRIESGSQRAAQGVELAGSAGDRLTEIVTSSRTLRGMVESIAAAAEEQASASDEIARAVETINSVTRESSQSAGQAAQAANDLAQQAETLQSVVARFRLEE